MRRSTDGPDLPRRKDRNLFTFCGRYHQTGITGPRLDSTIASGARTNRLRCMPFAFALRCLRRDLFFGALVVTSARCQNASPLADNHGFDLSCATSQCNCVRAALIKAAYVVSLRPE
jgi:hypothetical protein